MKIKILAAIVDTRQLTLYKDDGEQIVIKQGDKRLQQILDEVTPQIVTRGYAEVEITDIKVVSAFEEFEKQSGMVRFFKVAREKLANLFAPPVNQAAVGKIPGKDKTIESLATVLTNVAQTLPALEHEPVAMTDQSSEADKALKQSQAAIAEIMSHAQPVSDPNFNTDNVRQQGNIVETTGQTINDTTSNASHTVIAVVDNKIIPDMERIETHFQRAAKLGTLGGVELFLKRLAAVIDQRSHSVEDLLKFMERADMPIADDGSVIIYKVLRKKDGKYVDCHSGNVSQQIGSYVCMDEKLVDRNRNNECSMGLHVARRGYIKGFSGDVCVLAKLAPEDVITVPPYEANKMRVMGYHILAELTPAQYDLLKRNKPITELDDGKILLGKMLAGQHIRRIEEVRITGPMGSNVIITPIAPNTPVARDAPVVGAVVPVTIKPVKAEPVEALGNPETEKLVKAVNPKDVVKNVAGLSRKDQAQKLFKTYEKNPTEKNLKKLVDFKKSVKQGWKALGIDETKLK